VAQSPTVNTNAATYSFSGYPATNVGVSSAVTASTTDPNFTPASANGTFIITRR